MFNITVLRPTVQRNKCYSTHKQQEPQITSGLLLLIQT